MEKQINSNNRIVYLDIVRILACFLVVLVHVSAQHIFDQPADSASFKIYAAYNCFAYCGVALYIMISGALSLNENKEITVKYALKKFIHFYLLFFIWKIIYFIFSDITEGSSIDVKKIILDTLQERGHYHLWFLPTIAILYLFLPIIKKSIQSDKKACELFLIVFFALSILLETAYNFEFKFKYIFVRFFQYNDFYLFTGYLGYFILGHYINAFGEWIKKPLRIAVYVLAVIALPVSGLVDSYISIRDGESLIPLNTPFSVPTFIMATALFLLIKNSNKEKPGKITSFLASLTFGIYLIHPMILVFTDSIGFNGNLLSPVVSLPLITIIVTVVTAIPVVILISIPYINKLVK